MSQSRREIWTERMARYRDCSLTVREFCAREGVSQPSFYQWKRKLAECPSPAVSFVPVSFQHSSSVSLATVKLPGGAEVELSAQVDSATLQRIFAAVVAATDCATSTETAS